MKQSSRFEGLLDRYFETELERHPASAAQAGLREGEGKLGRATPDFLENEERGRRATLRDLEQISPRDLSSEQHLDRLALRAKLNRECEDFERKRFKAEPAAPEFFFSCLVHELQRIEREPARAVSNLVSLLRGASDFFEESAECIAAPDPVWLRVMRETANGTDSLLDAVSKALTAAAKNSPPEAARQSLIAGAAKACRNYTTRISELPLAKEGTFALGAAGLQRRVREELGLDYSLGEIESLAQAEVLRINELLKGACRKTGFNDPSEAIEEARKTWNPSDLLTAYREETGKLKAFVVERKIVTLPANEELQVTLVPEFMRPLFPVAAYSAPGAFERRQRGTFWVNDLSVEKTSEDGKRAERAQHFGLELTCAHEGYPGHHLQFVTANRHPRRWRRLFAHAIFYEGWTLWCEEMLTTLNYKKAPWFRLQQLHDALWRAHRILVDLRLQTGRYTHRRAANHLQRHLGFTRSRAEADVNWYCGSPGTPMSYWLGRLENERLRSKLMKNRGWTLRRFNDWLLAFGTLPQSWIERHGLE
jgi:uncharacterized protein (DUF885 family)